MADLLRSELADLLARAVKDPGVGFVTITTVRLSSDLQLARVYYTALADEAGRRATARALDRAAPFLRREISRRLRLKRTPDLRFVYDESIERQDRIERIIQELHDAEPSDQTDPGENEPER